MLLLGFGGGAAAAEVATAQHEGGEQEQDDAEHHASQLEHEDPELLLHRQVVPGIPTHLRYESLIIRFIGVMLVIRVIQVTTPWLAFGLWSMLPHPFGLYRGVGVGWCGVMRCGENKWVSLIRSRDI